MSRQTRKGYAGENHCAKMFNGWGTEGGCPTRARRGDGTIGEDVYVHVGAAEFRFECKFHKDDIKTIRKWFTGTDAIYFRCNHEEPWIALKPNALRDMLQEAYRAGALERIASDLRQPLTLRIKNHKAKFQEVGGQPVTKGDNRSDKDA